jgi:hypothetical protein
MTRFASIRLLGVAALAGASVLWAGCENNTSTSTQPSPSSGTLSTAAADAVKAGQAKVDEVLQYIKDNKLDAADKALTALENNKASLPPEIQNKLPEVRAALNAAKARVGGMKLPGT